MLDAVETMATDYVPQEHDVLVNDDFGIVEVSLTDKEAKDLESQSGVVAVEDDEMGSLLSVMGAQRGFRT